MTNTRSDTKLEQHRQLGRQVLERIGRPEGYLKTDVRPTYADKYRVNIWVQGVNGARIAYSETVRG